VGCLIQWAGSISVSEVIGIVPGVRSSPLNDRATPRVYAPLYDGHARLGSGAPPLYLYLRVADVSQAAPGHVAGENPEEIHKVDRQIPYHW